VIPNYFWIKTLYILAPLIAIIAAMIGFAVVQVRDGRTLENDSLLPFSPYLFFFSSLP